MEDWSDSLPPDLKRQLSTDVRELDSTPPPSGEQDVAAALYAEERVHSGDLILEPLHEPGERTPVASWLRDLPPPLPRPQ